jgi:hypothetical protein
MGLCLSSLVTLRETITMFLVLELAHCVTPLSLRDVKPINSITWEYEQHSTSSVGQYNKARCVASPSRNVCQLENSGSHHWHAGTRLCCKP